MATNIMGRVQLVEEKTVSNLPSLSLFPLLPPELRQKVWCAALWDATMSVVSIRIDGTSEAAGETPLTREALEHFGVSSLVSSCVEAYLEWKRMSCHFSPSFPMRVCIPRTICLLQSVPRSHMSPAGKPYLDEEAISFIQHIAFVITSGMHLMDVFAAFTKFHHLKTIIIVIPPYSLEGTRHLDRHKVSYLARTLAESMDKHQPLVKDEKIGQLGLLLRGDPPSKAVKAFYSRRGAPQVKLLTPRHSQYYSNESGLESGSPQFSLIEYI